MVGVDALIAPHTQGWNVMRLTAFSDYCLRVLMFVAVREDSLVTIDEIASTYGISRNHLMKVVTRLAQLGHIETVRGKGGGLRLAGDPRNINIGALLRETEHDLVLVECFQTSGNRCAITPACVLRGALREALEAFLAVLDRYTLADLAAPQRELARLLDLHSPG